MRGSVNSWSKVWLVVLMVGFVALVQVTQAQAWGVYFGAHGGRGTVKMTAPGDNFGGTSPARELIFNSNLNEFIPTANYAYIKYITGFDFDGNPHPWAGGPEARNNLDTALIKFKLSSAYSELPDEGLSVSLYHISDDSWKADEITFANSPHFNDPLTATLLDTQTVVTSAGFVTWNLLNNDRYRPLWQSQDFDDYTISVMLKVDEIPGNLGKAAFLEDGISLILEGQTSPVPLPGAILLFGSGLMGLGLRAARRRVKNF